MSPEPRHWDPSQLGFVAAVLRTMVGLCGAVSVGAVLLFRRDALGALAGGLVAVALYLLAMQAGRAVADQRRFGWILAGFLFQQFALWAAIVLLVNVGKVSAAGFLFGVSILPIAILLTLLWYALRGRRSSS